jgi:2-phosphosulfolactate phosphatase
MLPHFTTTVRATVSFNPHILDELDLREKTVVVIDVLRASTTICYAMQAGAKEIIPVASVDQAMKIVGNLFTTSTLLCGERGSKRINGFHLGNSPSEYTQGMVEGKSLILATTNGSVALTKAKHAKHSYVGCFVNMSAVVNVICELPEAECSSLTIICSGRAGDFSLEDAVCAGMLLQELAANGYQIELTDGAKTVLSLYGEYGSDLFKTLSGSDHGAALVELGFVDDIRIASIVDSVPIVPVLEQTIIKRKLIF